MTKQTTQTTTGAQTARPASLTDRTVLITGATGDTGRAAVRESIALGLKVRAMVHRLDARSKALEVIGAQVVVGDLLEINTVRAAMERHALADRR